MNALDFSDELSEQFIDQMMWSLNTMFPLDGSPECMDAVYMFAAASL